MIQAVPRNRILDAADANAESAARKERAHDLDKGFEAHFAALALSGYWMIDVTTRFLTKRWLS